VLGQFGRVLTLGQMRNEHVNFVLTFPLVNRRGRALTGLVGVVGEHDTFGEITHGLEVIFAKGRAARRHGTRHPGHEERDDVGVTLTDDDLVGLDDVVLGPVERIERATLGVDRGLR